MKESMLLGLGLGLGPGKDDLTKSFEVLLTITINQKFPPLLVDLLREPLDLLLHPHEQGARGVLPHREALVKLPEKIWGTKSFRKMDINTTQYTLGTERSLGIDKLTSCYLDWSLDIIDACGSNTPLLDVTYMV